ncbi:MAG TPA: thioredoxin family protein [Vicinamibacterales bacterium]|nr:thioredoxin family protein [Vicinamibacterales bacterium]
MVATPSTMLPLGTLLPAFALPDFDGRTVSTAQYEHARALLVAFICQHCPFVRHIRTEFARFAREYQPRGLVLLAVNSNDIGAFPEDGPEGMRQEAQAFDYVFPYLFDESQDVAKTFRAACTPDLFLFDASRQLVYRGQFDDSRPRAATPITGRDIRAAVDAVLESRDVSPVQRPSIGCNIKWKPGNEPDYV